MLGFEFTSTDQVTRRAKGPLEEDGFVEKFFPLRSQDRRVVDRLGIPNEGELAFVHVASSPAGADTCLRGRCTGEKLAKGPRASL